MRSCTTQCDHSSVNDKGVSRVDTVKFYRIWSKGPQRPWRPDASDRTKSPHDITHFTGLNATLATP